MKKEYVKLFLFPLLLALAGCSTFNNGKGSGDGGEPYQLKVPGNFRYDEESKQLKWSIVDNASGYVVCVGLDEIQSSVNLINISEFKLDYGKYSAKVRAVGSYPYISSSYCQEIEFDYYDETIDDTSIIDNINNIDKTHINAFKGEQTNKLEIFDSANIEDEYYIWYFDLGTVLNTPIYSSYAFQYVYEGMSLDVDFNEIDTDVVCQNKTESVEVIDSHSYTESVKFGFSETLKTGLNFFVKFGGEITFSQEVSASFNQSWTNIHSASESVSNSYQKTYEHGYSIHIPFSEANGFKKNYWYRVTFFEPIKTYGVLIYDALNDEFSAGYDTFFVQNSKACMIEENDSGFFNYEKNKTIDFDLDEAKELALNNIPKNDSSDVVFVKDAKSLNTAMLNASSSTKIRLLNDIIIPEEFNWISPSNFYGELNGNGKIIRNLKIGNGKTESNVEGIYGMIEELSGSIRNVVFDNLIINVWKYHDNLLNFYLGGICGIMNNNSYIENVDIISSSIYGYHDNDTDKKSSKAYVGGLVGNMGGGTIFNCSLKSSTSIEGQTHVYRTYGSTADTWCFVGGFVGYQDGGEISCCKRFVSENTTVTSTTYSGRHLSAYHSICGGIVGYQNSGSLKNDCVSYINGINAYADCVDGKTATTSEIKTGKTIGNLQK